MYSEDLIRSAERHLRAGLYGVSCYESRQAALSSLAMLGAGSSHSLRDAYAEAVKRGAPRDSQLATCLGILDSLNILTSKACDDACSDELPGGYEASDATEEDARKALECAKAIIEYARRALGSPSRLFIPRRSPSSF
ncbi:MAG: HEPN domain-containing protein [Acidilobus sp.]|jgi:HEPN domain-containing protein